MREAETLASLAQSVSGPADTPPAEGALGPWVDDWTARAKRALDRAQRLITAPSRASNAGGRRIVKRVREGAHAIRERAGKARQKVDDIISASNRLAWGAGLGGLALLLAALYVWKKF